MIDAGIAISEIRCSGVGKQYGGNPVLQDIDLTIAKGEFVSLLGPSGCGKSTLLKMIAGLVPASSGEIAVNGMTPGNAREMMSFIFQDPTLLPWRTVQRNVELGLELEGAPRERRKKKAMEALALVGLSAVANFYPQDLSGGMKMRVSIARALASRPQVLLMDEPFAALDEITRDRMNEELMRLQQEHGWTVIFVTHSVSEAVFLSSRIVLLRANPGRILGTVAVDLGDRRTRETRDTEKFEETVTRVSKLLRGAQYE
ncbi:MAG TPA: ABC transporter ATP-binding protein [Acidobacteriaceae bacterium]|nr:ABC transporter ATP-binding protein [Acidobacteriaceae bacterium]